MKLPVFQRLRWKLALSYVLYTPLVLLSLLFLLFVITTAVIELFFVPPLVLYGLQQYQGQLRPFFVHNGVPDQQALAFWIKNPGGYPAGYQPEYRVIVDSRGEIVASTTPYEALPGTFLQTRLSPAVAASLQEVLSGRGSDQGIARKETNGAIVAIVPIEGNDNRVRGALIDNTGPGIYMQEALYWLQYDSLYILISVSIYTFFAMIIGTIGGFFTARTITRRLNTLSAAAENWSQGNFTTFAQDKSSDELGQLFRNLNRMAEHLCNLLQTRQQLAISEERNRMARDLHDSVKQHIFVIALQVGTAKLRLERGQQEVEAWQSLTEAESVLHQVQEELKTLISALRPVVLEEKGLRGALQELVGQWEHQTGIQTQLEIEIKEKCSLLIEEALFRIVQEALSNAARHSQASSVRLRLVSESGRITLSITDNGRGFSPEANGLKGVGIRSMRERMQALGGDIEIESQPGQGMHIIAHCTEVLSTV